jgi:acyl carrier protein
VTEIVAEVIDLEVVSEETDLFEVARIDSLALVELIFALEQEFGVSLPLETLDVEHFRSVRAISALVADVTSGRVGAHTRGPQD